MPELKDVERKLSNAFPGVKVESYNNPHSGNLEVRARLDIYSLISVPPEVVSGLSSQELIMDELANQLFKGLRQQLYILITNVTQYDRP